MSHFKIRTLQARLERHNNSLRQFIEAKVKQLADIHLQSRGRMSRSRSKTETAHG
jgi:hypothetical protein